MKAARRHSVYDYYDKARKTGQKLRILRLDIWGTVSVFIVDLNADIRGGFTNLTADYQKLRMDIRTMQNVTNRNLIDPNKP